ncbi:hypothetical protein BLNAU_22734 [Blattamonas nauphoetae]|uniref:Uncharacterized protein n=1 Tax=Blattamonas nauphoetae TaxID=2049346 RepID=A0ABQ9WS79_9EUKA|nr:hypothetical protein BLNAU_22734 [Blattamonas nauphoetae]
MHPQQQRKRRWSSHIEDLEAEQGCRDLLDHRNPIGRCVADWESHHIPVPRIRLAKFGTSRVVSDSAVYIKIVTQISTTE